MNCTSRIITFILAAGAGVCAAQACTAFVVGKKASATGRVIVGHNNDGDGAIMKYALLDATQEAPALCERGRVSVAGGPAPKIYWHGVFSKDGLSTGDVLLNEHGVFVCSNHGGFYNRWGDQDGTQLPDEGEASERVQGGIGLALRFAVARQARTAAEGVSIATNLLCTYGYGNLSRTFMIADKDEAWVLCAAWGRRYVARRCPDDAVMAYPNIYPVGKILPGDIVSPNIEARRGDFDFAAAYQGIRTADSPSQRYRRLDFYRVAAGVTVSSEELDPWSVKPTYPVTAADLKRGFSSHFEGTDHMTVHPEEKAGVIWPICRRVTLESVVCAFGERPEETCVSLAKGRPCETPYDEFRPFGKGGVPSYFATGKEAEKLLAERCLPPVSSRYRTPGLIGGMGPAAACDLMMKVIANTDAADDQHHVHMLVDQNTDVPDRTAAILSGGEDPLPQLLKSARRLRDAGADFLCMSCNTAHYFHGKLAQRINIPVLNMPAETAKELRRQGVRKVAVLATDGTVRTRVYHRYLEAEGIEVLVPQAEDQKTVMHLIYGCVKKGVPASAYPAEEVRGMMSEMRSRGAEKFVLACTELPIAFSMLGYDEGLVDPTDVLARAIVREAGAPLRK